MTHHAVKLDEPSEQASKILWGLINNLHCSLHNSDPEEEGKHETDANILIHTGLILWEDCCVGEIWSVICGGILNLQIKAKADLHGIKTTNELCSY